MITLADQVACLHREISLRRHVYPKWIREGRMTRATADHEIACMEAALATVEKVKMLEEVSTEMERKTES